MDFLRMSSSAFFDVSCSLIVDVAFRSDEIESLLLVNSCTDFFDVLSVSMSLRRIFSSFKDMEVVDCFFSSSMIFFSISSADENFNSDRSDLLAEILTSSDALAAFCSAATSARSRMTTSLRSRSTFMAARASLSSSDCPPPSDFASPIFTSRAASCWLYTATSSLSCRTAFSNSALSGRATGLLMSMGSSTAAAGSSAMTASTTASTFWVGASSPAMLDD
mmetsp:Transcript_14335/g.47904  ORF Transcript_14335/g.47904 Transcript_14335/m.47904 type:complete len:221 (+) Transcript_14335:1101-1763(+)